MPSNYTEHFKLSQWEQPDKVLMDDFNDDNQKIDAALLCHPSAELIAAATVEAETQQIEFDISQVDWSRYMALALIVDAEKPRGFRVTMRSGSEQCTRICRGNTPVSTSGELADLSYASHMFALFPVFYDGSHSITAIAFGNGENDSTNDQYISAALCGGGGTGPLNRCKSMFIYNRNSTFVPGDRAVLWGVK